VHQLYDVRNEEGLSYDPHGFATLFSSNEAAVDFGRLMPGQPGIDVRAQDDREDDAYVLGGMLSYSTMQGSEVFVAKSSWVVARPGEPHGYWNRGGKPVTLFRFRPRSAKRSASGSQRIYKPSESRSSLSPAQSRIVAYETPASRGETLTLHPGEPAPFHASFCCATFVTTGRVMALFGREKISLDAGEGIGFVGERGEIVGVGGLSNVVVFTTTV
jgi:hypothetical protein